MRGSGRPGFGGGPSDPRGDVGFDRRRVGHPGDRAGRVLARHPQQPRLECADEDGNLDAPQVGRSGVDAELLTGVVDGVASQERGEDLDVLLGVAPGVS